QTASVSAAGTITIETPSRGSAVSGPVQVSGRVSVTPPEKTLVGSVVDAQGTLVNQDQITINSPGPGQPGTFTFRLPFAVMSDGPGKIEVSEYRTTDEPTLADAAVEVTLTVPSSSWLDQPQPANWNGYYASIPSAPTLSPAPGEAAPPLDPQCTATERAATTQADEMLTAAGWRLFGQPVTSSNGEVKVVSALSGYDGMCRPMGYQQFVFAEGERFIGMTSPAPMASREDGAADTPTFTGADTLSVPFSRYGPEDPACCPTRQTVVTYRIDRQAAWPLLVPVSATTSPTASPAPEAAPMAAPAPAAPAPAPAGCSGQLAGAEGIQLCLPSGIASGVSGRREARVEGEVPGATEAQRIITLQGYPVVTPRQDPAEIHVFAMADFQRPGAQRAAAVQALRRVLTERPAFSGRSSLPAESVNLPALIVEASTPFLARPVYLDTPWGAGVRGVGAMGQDLSPLVGRDIQYLFAGISADGRWLVVASAPLAAPDMPAVTEESATRDPEGSIDVVHRHLSLLDESRYTPDLHLLDELLRSLTIQDS
ncbi:MAG TPA: LppP/LprE family lipoprotein, partial [Chloroflexota bacterium]|nr:LppP/LprE family lipoprotein [Chloroflexota bacterium]